MRRTKRERLLVERMQDAAAELRGTPRDEWWAAYDHFKRCRDEALLSFAKPIRGRKRGQRKET